MGRGRAERARRVVGRSEGRSEKRSIADTGRKSIEQPARPLRVMR